MANLIILSEYLEVNSVPLATPAFFAADISALENGPTMRNKNTVIPGSPGTLRVVRTPTETVLSFPVNILGAKDREGTPHADPRAGRDANKDYLLANIGLGLQTGDGTVTVVWHRHDGTTKSATATVEALGNTVRKSSVWDICRLDLTVQPWFA